MKQPSLEQSIEKFKGFAMDGNHLALDFTNTIDWRNTEKEHEWLDAYTDLVAWGMRVGLLDSEAAEALAQKAQREPSEAATVLLNARKLRELLFRIFNAVIGEHTPDLEDWQLFNRTLRTAMSSVGIDQREGRFVWSFAHDGQRLDFFLGSVFKAASDLLIDGDLSRLKRCSTPECQWLFLDSSKNNSRRWCDMQSCGNRAKAKRYYQKTRPPRN